MMRGGGGFDIILAVTASKGDVRLETWWVVQHGPKSLVHEHKRSLTINGLRIKVYTMRTIRKWKGV